MNPNAQAFSVPARTPTASTTGFSHNAPPFSPSGGDGGNNMRGGGGAYGTNAHYQGGGGGGHASHRSTLNPSQNFGQPNNNYNNYQNRQNHGGNYQNRGGPNNGGYGNNYNNSNGGNFFPPQNNMNHQNNYGGGAPHVHQNNMPPQHNMMMNSGSGLHNNSNGHLGHRSQPQHHQQQPQQQAVVPPPQKQAPSGPPVVLLFSADVAERAEVAAHVASTLSDTYTTHHIVFGQKPETWQDDDAGADNSSNAACSDGPAVVTTHYKYLRAHLAEAKAAAAANNNAKAAFVFEAQLNYHFTEMYYFFDELRSAQVFPTHVVYIDHQSLETVEGSAEYDDEQRTRHPLAFETCLTLFQSVDNFTITETPFPADNRINCDAMRELLDFINTRKEPLRKLPENIEPEGVFKFISLHPDASLLTSMAERLISLFNGQSDLYAKPVYIFDYGTIARNCMQLPSFSATIDLSGVDTLLAKIGEQYLAFFPKFIAVATLSEDQVPEPLRRMTAGTSPATAATSGTASPAPPGSEPAPASSSNDVAWVINATICYSEDGDSPSCTIYAKDIIYANGHLIAGHCFESRHKQLSALVEERPADSNIIIVRQRYYPALETERIFEKLAQAASSGKAGHSGAVAVSANHHAGNGVWFVNPGKAELRPDSLWNFKFPLHEGGFDARLWNARQDDAGEWSFDVLTIGSEGVEESIGTVEISKDQVEAHNLNDGLIVRLLARKEVKPPPEPVAPAPRGKGAKGKPQPAQREPEPAEPTYKFEYLARQPWTFVPTSENPCSSRFAKPDLLEGIAALK